jgi:hypothetical protein
MRYHRRLLQEGVAGRKAVRALLSLRPSGKAGLLPMCGYLEGDALTRHVYVTGYRCLHCGRVVYELRDHLPRCPAIGGKR